MLGDKRYTKQYKNTERKKYEAKHIQKENKHKRNKLKK